MVFWIGFISGYLNTVKYCSMFKCWNKNLKLWFQQHGVMNLCEKDWMCDGSAAALCVFTVQLLTENTDSLTYCTVHSSVLPKANFPFLPPFGQLKTIYQKWRSVSVSSIIVIVLWRHTVPALSLAACICTHTVRGFNTCTLHLFQFCLHTFNYSDLVCYTATSTNTFLPLFY